jgi:hypothetical protein
LHFSFVKVTPNGIRAQPLSAKADGKERFPDASRKHPTTLSLKPANASHFSAQLTSDLQKEPEDNQRKDKDKSKEVVNPIAVHA